MRILLTFAALFLGAAAPAACAVQEGSIERRSPQPKSLPAPAPADHYAEEPWTKKT